MESNLLWLRRISPMLYLFFILCWLLSVKADLELVTSNDYMRIIKDFSEEPVKEIEIAGFKNYQFFGQNSTVNGTAWYMTDVALTTQAITEQCFSKLGNDTSPWVVLMPFDNTNFITNLELINTDLKRVEGVIFTYSGNPQISSPAPDKDIPRVISFVKVGELLENNIQEQTFPESTEYKFQLEHRYIEHCDVMKPAFKFYLIAISIWGFATILHVLWTWCIKKEYAKHLQKIMLFVPIFFVGYTLIDYVYFLACPWNQANGVQYLQIVQIALVTIFNTLFVGLCCFISKGWSILRNSFTREELSSITMIVGIFYLVYSAYFIASDIPSLKVVIIVILIIMYVWVALTCLKNCILNIKTLSSHIEVTGEDEVIIEALKLKKYLMINFCAITMAFYTNKIIYSALFTFINNNTVNRNMIIINLFVELLIITYMLFTFRARKWPEYFSLDILYQRLGQNDDQENIPKSVILNASIPASWVMNHRALDMTLNGHEVNYFKIRNYKEPQVALMINSADQEAPQLQKLSPEEFKTHVYSDIKLAIEEEVSESSDSD